MRNHQPHIVSHRVNMSQVLSQVELIKEAPLPKLRRRSCKPVSRYSSPWRVRSRHSPRLPGSKNNREVLPGRNRAMRTLEDKGV